MVNTLSHFGIGILFASVLGLTGRRRWLVVLLAILPDIDFITTIIFIVIDGNFKLSHNTHNQLFYLLYHREFMHSLLFLIIVIFILWLWKRDRLLTAAGTVVLFSHFYLDYATAWKMRPLYPLDVRSSTLGSIDFIDPIVHVISFIVIFMSALEVIKKPGKWRGGLSAHRFVMLKGKKVFKIIVIVFLVWCLITPVMKLSLVNHISSVEGADINYEKTYPITFGKFLCVYSFNSTHYKILEVSYWLGVERSDYIEKVSHTDVQTASKYIDRATELYESSLPKEIDYIVYSVSEDDNSVIVTLSDARNPYVEYWAYFKNVYRFVFDKNSGEYEAYISRPRGAEEKVPNNWFE